MTEHTRLIWGRRAVLEALRAGHVRVIYLAADNKPASILQEIRHLAEDRSVAVREMPSERLRQLAPGQVMQGVAAHVGLARPRSLDDVIATIANDDRPGFLLVLDQIQDPHNLGALIRSANGAGVDAVIMPERRSASLTGTVAKTSAGAIHATTTVTVVNLSRALSQLRSAGIWVVGLDDGADSLIYDAPLTGPVALVVGGEAAGMRRLTRGQCDLVVRLPMFGVVESLNASVAGSIAMFEVVRQRLAQRETG